MSDNNAPPVTAALTTFAASCVIGGPPAIAFMLATLAARYSLGHLPAWTAALVFPSAWTAYEFLYSLVSPNGTFWSLAYSQADFLPVLQIASLTGIWGIVFVLTLVPSAIAISWSRRTFTPLVLAVTILLMVLGYGHLSPTAACRVRLRSDGSCRHGCRSSRGRHHRESRDSARRCQRLRWSHQDVGCR
jgi:apolipoprotein N-acyltransferase